MKVLSYVKALHTVSELMMQCSGKTKQTEWFKPLDHLIILIHTYVHSKSTLIFSVSHGYFPCHTVCLLIQSPWHSDGH